MTSPIAKVASVNSGRIEDVNFAELIAEGKPVLFKGFARGLPLVQAGLNSIDAAMDHIRPYYHNKPLLVFKGDPSIKGRFAYNSTVDGFNYVSEHMALDRFFDLLLQHKGDLDPPSFYMGSIDLETFLPGLLESDGLPLNAEMFQQNSIVKSIWMGNRTTACAHYDISHNIAVCMAGHRRFTLFEPQQIHNLYPGPLDLTPGGQAISMVDFTNPDFIAYPRSKDALDSAQIAELEPGDILFYPSMWWHHVEALDSFNILMNYWWNTTPAFVDTPMNTLMHGLLSLRERPDAEKKAWKAVFDYYLFGPAETARDHIPPQGQGILTPLDALKARKLRATLLNRFNR